MKVISALAMAELEAEAFKRGCLEDDFMENAGRGIADHIIKFTDERGLAKKILLLCGKGNNGGDAYVAGCHLMQKNFQVSAIQVESLEHGSKLCQKNGARFLKEGGQLLPQGTALEGFSVLVDGLFGTGFKGEVKEPYYSLIKAANASKIPILAIDIPSGLNGNTGEVLGIAIQAKQTFFLGLPKTGFFLKDGWNYVGKLLPVDFGLPQEIVAKAKADFNLLTDREVACLLPPIKRNRHKYDAGYVIGLAGSPNMPGAALLASLAALRGGCGIIRLLHPEGMQAQLSHSPFELIKVPYQYDQIADVLTLMNKGSATFVGPGMGRSVEVQNLLNAVMPHLEKPCVIDADALTLYAENAFQLPKNAVLTPHTGEMQSLLHQKDKLLLDLDTLKLCQQFVEEKKVTLVLKGATTFIFHPGQSIQLSTKGDPAMATAGSGDVLTGLIAALLAQGLSCQAAATLGVYLHGLAGESAVKERRSSYGLIASDLIAHFKEAYHSMSSTLKKD